MMTIAEHAKTAHPHPELRCSRRILGELKAYLFMLDCCCTGWAWMFWWPEGG
jgi:hypothetical protein